MNLKPFQHLKSPQRLMSESKVVALATCVSKQFNHTGVRVREAPTQVQTYYQEVISYDPVVKLDQNSPCNLPLLFHC